MDIKPIDPEEVKKLTLDAYQTRAQEILRTGAIPRRASCFAERAGHQFRGTKKSTKMNNTEINKSPEAAPKLGVVAGYAPMVGDRFHKPAGTSGSLFGCIVADPPWQICTGGKGGWGTPQMHYPVMPTDKIIRELQWVKPLIAEQAHCYIWVVNNKLQDGLDLMKELGFHYITNLVWVKDKIGMGQYFRGQHELLLFGRKGKPMPYRYENGKRVTISTVVSASKQEHSRKPDGFYSIFERTSPGPYLELFARRKREGWSSWGNEVPNDVVLSLANK